MRGKKFSYVGIFINHENLILECENKNIIDIEKKEKEKNINLL